MLLVSISHAFKGPLEALNQGVKKVFRDTKRWRKSHSKDMLEKSHDRELLLWKVCGT
jgi:K+-sensing histidine kinase KdpD